MSIRQIVTLGIIVIIAAAIAWAVLSPGGLGGDVSEEGGSPLVSTRGSAPTNVAVPEKGANNVPENVATPTVVGPAGVNTTASYRSFDISAAGGKFTPDTVIVRVKDTVHINLTAVDRDYDFTQPDYGFKVPVPKGQSKPIEFGATAPGKFTFYCSVCGGPDRGPVGYLVVVTQ